MEQDLARVWEVEEIPRVKPISKENRQCVEHYDTTTYVADDGCITVHVLSNLRHVLRTTFKQPSRDCSPWNENSRIMFMSSKYRDFIKEFLDMSHLEQAPQTSGLCYYLPHHRVLKDITTTKLRVVFDASGKSQNGNSLNDCLLLGPRLQDVVFDDLIRSPSICIIGRCDEVVSASGFSRIRLRLQSKSVA